MFREWKALFLEGLPIYEDEVVYLAFCSLNSSFNNREQSQVLFWCCGFVVRIACAQPALFVPWVPENFRARFPFSVKSLS